VLPTEGLAAESAALRSLLYTLAAVALAELGAFLYKLSPRTRAASLIGTLFSVEFRRRPKPHVDTIMRRMLRPVALSLFAAALAAPLFAEPTPGPPDWADAGASIYLGMKPREPASQEPASSPQAATAVDSPAVKTARAAAQPHVDSAIAPAVFESPNAPAADTGNRRLAPPRQIPSTVSVREADKGTPAAFGPRFEFGLPFGSLQTILSALAIVIGIFLLFAWLLRRNGQKTGAALPAEVVSVLGRVLLAPRHVTELLRVGNKLVLVSITPAGAEPITEVSDPVEVDRLVGLCQQYSPHSTTKAFEQVFRQLSREAAPSGFSGNDSLPQTISSAAAAYRAHRGETGRG
jgi:flagellar biogenesis protein FliO